MNCMSCKGYAQSHPETINTDYRAFYCPACLLWTVDAKGDIYTVDNPKQGFIAVSKQWAVINQALRTAYIESDNE